MSTTTNSRYTLMCRESFRDRRLCNYARRIRIIDAAGRYTAERLRHNQICTLWILDEGNTRTFPRQLQLEIVTPEKPKPDQFCLLLRDGDEPLQIYCFTHDGKRIDP